MRFMFAPRRQGPAAPIVVLGLALLPCPGGAQDEVALASAPDVAAGSTVVLDLGVRDRPGTLLGGDVPAARAIQDLSVTVRWSPAAAVDSVSFRPGGVAVAAKTRFEHSVGDTATASWIVAFASPLPLVLGGLESIGELEVQVAPGALPGSTVDLDLLPATTALGNRSGSDVETVSNGELALVSGTLSVADAIFADGFENGGVGLWSGSVP